MKVKVGSFFVDASGKLGGAQLGRNNGQMIMQSKSNANKSPSTLQQLQRNRTQLIMASWSNLSDANRLLWLESAKSYTRSNIFNDIKKINGFELFNIVNQNRLRLGLSLMSTPAAHNVPNPPYTITVTSSETEITLFSDAYDSNTFVDVYVSPIISKGMSNPKKYLRRLITLTAAELASGYDIFTEYTERYGSVSNGDNLFLGIKTISNVSYYSSKKVTVNKPVIVIGGTTPPVYDADAQAFIDAVGTLTTTQEVAINNLVIGLKSAGVWSKCDAIYPFVGGTASSHKWNLKNPLDTDAAFSLTFYGGLTHNANGVTGNGTNGYADTHYVASVQQAASYSHSAIYCNTDNTWIASDVKELGVYQSDTQSQNIVLSHPTYGLIYRRDDAQKKSNLTVFQTSAGFTTVTRNGSTSVYAVKNGTLQNTQTNGTPNRPTNSAYLFNTNYSGPYSNGWSNQCLAYVTFGNGLTVTEAQDEYTIVQAYQTALGRNV